MKRMILSLMVGVAISLLVAGCGGKGSLSGLYPVSGTITLDSQPLDGATITLFPEAGIGPNNRPASATSDALGKFVVTTLKPGDGASPGKYKVSVTKNVVTKPLTEAEQKKSEDGTHVRDVVAESLLPAKYANSDKSGLSITVEEKKNEGIKIEITSK